MENRIDIMWREVWTGTNQERYISRDSLSPLLFVLCVIPLSLVLRNVKAGYEFKGKQQRINHLLFMDDLKLYGKSEVQIDSLVKNIQLISTDIGMEFGIEKCAVLILKRGQVVESEGIVLPMGKR